MVFLQGEEHGKDVVGLVDVSDFLTPTHDKQDFIHDKKYGLACYNSPLRQNLKTWTCNVV